MEEEIRRIFESISEHHDEPVRLGSRCESQVYYHVVDLSSEDLAMCARYVAERILNVCHPHSPDFLVELPDGYTGFARLLARELAPPGEELEVIDLKKIDPKNGMRKRLKNASVILVNDVITTARSCVEAHTLMTVNGASVLCWATLIDRTFGPGPVPVVAAFNGAPVRLLEEVC